jgi:hypothetical protein
MQRCLKDLREIFCPCEIQESLPLVSFRETAVTDPKRLAGTPHTGEAAACVLQPHVAGRCVVVVVVVVAAAAAVVVIKITLSLQR